MVERFEIDQNVMAEELRDLIIKSSSYWGVLKIGNFSCSLRLVILQEKGFVPDGRLRAQLNWGATVNFPTTATAKVKAATMIVSITAQWQKQPSATHSANLKLISYDRCPPVRTRVKSTRPRPTTRDVPSSTSTQIPARSPLALQEIKSGPL